MNKTENIQRRAESIIDRNKSSQTMESVENLIKKKIIGRGVKTSTQNRSFNIR